jgi:predicted transcriptional regulator of viral defense system
MSREVDTDPVIAALAVAQHGVVSRAQLLRLGLSDNQVDHRLRRRRLHRVHRGVFAVGHTALTVDGRRMAAVLALGGDAVLSHASAATAWALRRPGSGSIHVTVPSTAGRKKRAGIRLHRSGTLTRGETTTHRGIPITAPARTIIDLAKTIDGRPLEHALNIADQRQLLDFKEFACRPIPPSLQAVLSLYTASVTRSEMEERFIELCDDHGLPRPIANAHVEGIEVDFVWRAQRLIVEVDGYAYHRSPTSFEDDRERDVTLAIAGWTVLRFTWAQITRRPGWVARAVFSTLSVDRARANPRGSAAWTSQSAMGSLGGTSSTASPSAPPASPRPLPRRT